MQIKLNNFTYSLLLSKEEFEPLNTIEILKHLKQ
jgi:hypothetical protein